MKTWVYWYELLETIDSELRLTGYELPEAPSLKSSARILFEKRLHQETREPLDALIRRIILEPLKLPEMNTKERFCLHARISWLQGHLLVFHCPQPGYARKQMISPPDKTLSPNVVLEWLLIDTWRFRGEDEFLWELELKIRAGWFDYDKRWRVDNPPPALDSDRI